MRDDLFIPLKKCKDCLKMGLNYCLFWELNFKCEGYEINNLILRRF
jgi:hypothetical protein